MPHRSHFPPDFIQHLGRHLTSFRFELVIVWRVQIDEEGKVLPKLDLLPKAPQQGRACQGGGCKDLRCPTGACCCLLVFRARIKRRTSQCIVCIGLSVTRKQRRGETVPSPRPVCGSIPTVTAVVGWGGRVSVRRLSQPALPAALELDRNRVLETAPRSFRALLGVLGIEAALESLIKSLCTADSS